MKWKDMVYELAKKHLYFKSEEGCITNSAEVMKHASDTMTGAQLGLLLINNWFVNGFRIKGTNDDIVYNISICAYGNEYTTGGMVWNKRQRLLITIEGIILEYENPKLFGDNDLRHAGGTFKYLSPDKVSASGNDIRIKTIGLCAVEETITIPLPFSAAGLKNFLDEAHQLVENNQDLYDEAIDEFAPDNDDNDDDDDE